MDIDTGIIYWFTMTPWSRHDSREFENLIKYLPEIGAAFGDKAYSVKKFIKREALFFLHIEGKLAGW